MTLNYTVTELPPVWPGQRNATGKRSPFKTQWTRTLQVLAREIKHLGGTHVEIAVQLSRGAYDLRADGQLRADARPGRAVILSFRTPKGERLQFPCDTYGFWQDNVYAIAKTLENLRAIDRWGATQHKQYEGFKALPPSTTPALSTEQAAIVIASRSKFDRSLIVSDRETALRAVRAARAKAPPDAGGTTADFTLVQEAARVLSSHIGVTL